ncbi:MAG: MaoC family dehydratase [Ferruginibacter sp.]
MLVIQTHDEFKSHLNKETVISPWHVIKQEQVDGFAEATLDPGTINTDAEKSFSKRSTTAATLPGYFALSLIPFFWKQMVDVQNLSMQVNYGIEHLEFGQAIVAGSEVRCKGSLKAIANLRGITKATFAIELEIKDQPAPAITADIIFLCHFI